MSLDGTIRKLEQDRDDIYKQLKVILSIKSTIDELYSVVSSVVDRLEDRITEIADEDYSMEDEITDAEMEATHASDRAASAELRADNITSYLRMLFDGVPLAPSERSDLREALQQSYKVD